MILIKSLIKYLKIGCDKRTHILSLIFFVAKKILLAIWDVFLRLIPALIIFTLAFFITQFLVYKLTPKLGPLSILSEREHSLIARKQIPEIGKIVTLEKVGVNKIDPDRVIKIETAISDTLNEYNKVSSFPLDWFFKFDNILVFNNAVVIAKDDSIHEGTFDLQCNENNNDPRNYKVGSSIFFQKNVRYENFREMLKEAIKSLENCLANVDSQKVSEFQEYRIKEEYKYISNPQFVNFLATFFAVTLGLFGSLPVLREGVRFFRKGSKYFS